MSTRESKKKVATFSPRKNISTISLPRFRSERPRLYWPVPIGHDRIEINIQDTLENPQELGVEYLSHYVGSSGNKTTVTVGKVFKENYQEELVAVKIMMVQDRKAKDDVIKELRILQHVVHPHIIAAIGSCSTEMKSKIKFGILLFPLAEMNLKDHLDQSSMTHLEVDRLLSFYPCLCQAVNYLHTREKPIKHRDIKPSNILIGGDGEVILADFGISKQYDDKTKAVTIRDVEYTIKYAPPHVADEKPAGLEWDINCLGFVFLEMATVIFGKTIEDLLVFLRGTVISLPSLVRATGKTTSAQVTEVRFSVALDEGRLDEWLKVLKSQPNAILSHLPEGLANSKSSVEKFLRMIEQMMKTPKDGDEGVLASAYRVFDSMSQVCKYCRPASKNRASNDDEQTPGNDLMTETRRPHHPGEVPFRESTFGRANAQNLTSQTVSDPSRPMVAARAAAVRVTATQAPRNFASGSGTKNALSEKDNNTLLQTSRMDTDGRKGSSHDHDENAAKKRR